MKQMLNMNKKKNYIIFVKDMNNNFKDNTKIQKSLDEIINLLFKKYKRKVKRKLNLQIIA